MNDVIRLAAERAVKLFGDRGDGLFNGSSFSAAFTRIAGTRSPIDGCVVRAMLAGRADVLPLRGGSHYKLIALTG